MKVVIDIPDKLYKNLQSDLCCGPENLLAPIKEGFVLPPDHGRLIDADEVINKIMDEQQGLMQKLPYESGRIWEASVIMRIILKAPTVLEAEGENK